MMTIRRTTARRSPHAPVPPWWHATARLLSIVAVCVLGARTATGAVLGIPPPGGFSTPTPSAAPSPTPHPPTAGGQDVCNLPPASFVRCSGAPHVDEVQTILSNSVLQRTCGRFVAHHASGNAVLASSRLERTLKKGVKRRAWVLALRGCGLDQVRSIEVDGAHVAAKVVPAAQVERFLAGGPRVTGRRTPFSSELETVYVEFDIEQTAHTPHERGLSVVFGTRGSSHTQELKRIRLQIAHNGHETSRHPQKLRWEEETTLSFRGRRLANARLTGPACVKEVSGLHGNEVSFKADVTFHCPVPVEGEPGVTVNDPTCECAAVAYDRALDVYPELPKAPFNYLDGPIHVVANLDYLRSNPAVIGDSLSHGAFSGAVTARSQRWAYPHLVVMKMEGTPLVQNLIHAGPNLEDTIKSLVPGRYGPAPHGIDQEARHLGVLRDDELTDDPPEKLPTHAGISGFDYTNVLRTSGICLDKEGHVKRRSSAKVPEQICERRCKDEDGNELPSPSVDAQLGLGCSELTPIEMMEQIQPTFVFAAAAPNHALACAVTTTSEGCLEWDRFERDSAEVFRRLRAIPSIKGGIVFGIPPLGSIPYLAPYHPEELCQSGKTKLRAFWKDDDHLGEDEILDCEEREQLETFVEAANDRLRDLAAQNRYAYVDAIATFERLSDEGQAVRDEDGEEICRARTTWPTRTMDIGPDDLLHPYNGGNDAGCGLISLDGAHPTQLGHTVMANELITAIDEYYDVDVPRFDDAEILATWEFDDLAQDPIDMDDFMHLDFGELVGEGVGLSACLAPAAACVATSGLACLGAAEFEAILALTPVRDVCVEPVARLLVTELGFKPIDSAIEPAHCWDGHCPVAADTTVD